MQRKTTSKCSKKENSTHQLKVLTRYNKTRSSEQRQALVENFAFNRNWIEECDRNSQFKNREISQQYRNCVACVLGKEQDFNDNFTLLSRTEHLVNKEN
jgi:hypothetical protein